MIYRVSLFMLFLVLHIVSAYGQEDHLQSKTRLTSISLHKEYYNFNSTHQATYFLLKGGITFKDNSHLLVELIGTQYTEEGRKIYSPGDMNISYTREILPSSNGDFLGINACLKMHFPTGNSDLSGLFGHYTVEPMITYGWKLIGNNLTLSNQWRAYIPTIQAIENTVAPAFVRFEPALKYQYDDKWINVALDNRWVWNFDDFVIYYKVEGGIDLGNNYQLSGFYEKKIRGEALFDIYSGINIRFKF
ncbi:hypothetical protein [Flammeovirga agarivorans]|uniref:Outer membrane protein beta-barrel domain-containing protein n=1 Tax=Flammeovirga agarivorans TaxID=2726742 RepID=A0A7X8XX89_9BACT|nr:hypothetical protein [Flammeovirga agarivorans]NLR92943.1 hypothetical protein [Flammeovirga agarivorans]